MFIGDASRMPAQYEASGDHLVMRHFDRILALSNFKLIGLKSCRQALNPNIFGALNRQIR